MSSALDCVIQKYLSYQTLSTNQEISFIGKCYQPITILTFWKLLYCKVGTTLLTNFFDINFLHLRNIFRRFIPSHSMRRVSLVQREI